MFNKVSTKYNRNTADLGQYLRRRINSATDLVKLFTSLENQGYTCNHEEVVDKFYEKHIATTICGNFNGNDWVVTVFYYPTNNTDDKYKQAIIGIVY